MVDVESGIPLSAGIPQGDEQFIDAQAVEVIPYLSHGILTTRQTRDAEAIAFANALVAAAESLHDPIGVGEQETVAAAQAVHDRYPSVTSPRPDGDEIAIGNAIEAQTLAAAEALRTPYNSPAVFGEAVKTNMADAKFVPGVTDFPTTSQTAPDNRVERALEQGPQVIPYLSHGMTSDDVVGARPDDRADRFAHSDVLAPASDGEQRQRHVGRMERGADGCDRRTGSRPRPRTGVRLPSPAAARGTLKIAWGGEAKRALRSPLSRGPTASRRRARRAAARTARAAPRRS